MQNSLKIKTRRMDEAQRAQPIIFFRTDFMSPSLRDELRCASLILCEHNFVGNRQTPTPLIGLAQIFLSSGR